MRVMPLHSAIANKRTEIVWSLVDHDADVNAVQADDFYAAARSGSKWMLDVAQWLLDRSAQVNPRLKSSGQNADRIVKGASARRWS